LQIKTKSGGKSNGKKASVAGLNSSCCNGRSVDLARNFRSQLRLKFTADFFSIERASSRLLAKLGKFLGSENNQAQQSQE
jgi:hypothetical protein